MDPISIAMLAMQAYNTLFPNKNFGKGPDAIAPPDPTASDWKIDPSTKERMRAARLSGDPIKLREMIGGPMKGQYYNKALYEADQNKPPKDEGGSTTLEKMAMGASIGNAVRGMLEPSQRMINFGSRASGARPGNVSSRHLIGTGGKTPSLQELIAAMLRGR